MQFTTAFIAAAAAFLPLIEAHMVLINPPTYPDNKDNSPLDASGSNFPCKFPGGVGTASASGKTFTPGQSDAWELQGSAVHGGGSCQISITYDNPPTKNSVFKVVKSYMGGCPMAIDGNNGNDPTKAVPGFPVTLPTGLKAGEATFVWTWFNRIGNREMYMNCAPITIGGDSTSDDVFNGLPNMFVANAGNAPGNACTTRENFDIVFPNAGADPAIVDSGNFGAACDGGPSSPGSSGGNNGGSNPAPSSAPNLNEGGATATAVPTFSNIDSQPTMIPPVQTTMVVVPTPVPEPTQPIEEPPVAQPTGGNNSGSSGSSCNPSTESIICGSDLSMYSQCFMDGIARGPYAVPPGTVCDSTGMGGFKAKSAVSTRFLRRSARFHRRNLVHAHSL